MQKWIFLGAAVSLAACGVAAQERLSKPCRDEVIKLCAVSRDRSAIAGCLMEKQASLSTSCRSELRARVAGAGEHDGRETKLRRATQGGQEISYGDHSKQALDYYRAKISTGKPAPLVIFIHGGGWSIGDKKTGTGTKPGFYNDMGFNFASLNYRLVPEVKPDAQAADVAKAIAHLRSRATGLGFDP
ncbi:MAG: alpha/beta hydrolase, partial [Sphingorhabdus sp.]